MIGWELRELRLRVTKCNKFSKSSQMRNTKIQRKNPSKKIWYKNNTDPRQISPGEGLSEGLSKGRRGLMENPGDSGRGSGELRGTQGRTQELKGLIPLILENSGGNSGGTSPRYWIRMLLNSCWCCKHAMQAYYPRAGLSSLCHMPLPSTKLSCDFLSSSWYFVMILSHSWSH